METREDGENVSDALQLKKHPQLPSKNLTVLDPQAVTNSKFKVHITIAH
jgi:hypothetical protein